MQHHELETHHWNLPLSVVATTLLSACGPLIFIDDDGGYNTTDIGSTTDLSGPPTDPTSGRECSSSQECPPGQVCYYGSCIDDYGSDYDTDYGEDYGDTCGYDYGYCDTDTYGDTDTDGIPPECYSHVDCGDLRVCNGQGFCEDAQTLPACADAPVIVPLPLPPMSPDAFVSLSFVDADANPWQDLVVGRSGSAELLLGPGDDLPIDLPVPPGSTVIDATAADLDGDGQAELILSTQEGMVLVLASDGAGGYLQVTAVEEVGPVLDLATLNFNVDGMLDLAFRIEGGEARVYFGDGAGGFAEMYSLNAASPILSLVAGDLEGDVDGDLVVQDQGGAERFEGSNAGNLIDDGQLPGGGSPRGLLSGNVGPVPLSDVVGYTITPEATLLELWPDAQAPQYYSVLGIPELWADMGDVHADGVDDVVLAGQSSIEYVQGSNEAGVVSFVCISTFEYPSSATAMAVGDFDGDLRADVALGDAGGITVLLTQ